MLFKSRKAKRKRKEEEEEEEGEREEGERERERGAMGCTNGPPLVRAILMASFSLFLWFPLNQAVYEDQIGIWDWHKPYLGKVTHAVFQTQGTGRKRVIVATEQNVLASLNLRNGEIFWRRVFGDSDKIDALDILPGKYLFTLSGQGSTVRAWHLPDGQLVWETHLKSSSLSAVLHATSIDVNRKSKVVVVLGDETLYGISSIDGDILWQTATSVEGEYASLKAQLSWDKAELYGAQSDGTPGLLLRKISLLTGQVNMQQVSEFRSTLPLGEYIIVKDTLVALDVDGRTLLSSQIGGKPSLSFHVTDVQHLVPEQKGKARLHKTALNGVFGLRFSDQITLLKTQPLEGGFRVVGGFEHPTAISYNLELPDDKNAFAIVQHVGYPQDYRVSYKVFVMDGDEVETHSELVGISPNQGIVRQVYLNAYTRTDKSHGFRALVVTEDDSLSLLQQGEVVWSREDGLASIVDTTTAELPLERDTVSVAKVEEGLIEWLTGHLLKLKATVKLASTEELVAVQAARLNSIEKNKLTRDHNGFRKLLIVLTMSGKLYALHTGDGRIVWSKLLPAFQSLGGEKTLLKLFPWQVPHKHALDENPVVLVFGKIGEGLDARGVLAWVDLYTGALLDEVMLDYSVYQIIPLPHTDSSEQRLHLVIDSNLNAHLFPRTEESLEIFRTHISNTNFYFISKEEGCITGFAILCAVESADRYYFESEKIWTVSFPAETERIVATATRRVDEVVHTQAKVLTNQDVLFKYLNSHTLFVATVAPKATGMASGVSPEETWLVAYIIDTASGRILHRVKHPHMRGPVHVVFSENWVVYHYFNVRAHRYEMSVLEIYVKNRVDKQNILELMLGRHNATVPVSAYSYPDLDVKSQSYFFTHSVKTTTVTATSRGITTKQLLLGTVNDRVLALDKRLFNPRRTLNPTPAEREDGMLPLTDTIPINPQSYLTHGVQVEGLRGILTAPASLESTSLVFAYGIDLFFTRTTPSRTYDSLTEEFNYALLLITIVALVIAIGVTWYMSEQKELREKWK